MNTDKMQKEEEKKRNILCLPPTVLPLTVLGWIQCAGMQPCSAGRRAEENQTQTPLLSILMKQAATISAA